MPRALPVGVYYSGRERPYRAVIVVKQRYIYLGDFATIDEASATYLRAKANPEIIVDVQRHARGSKSGN
jgi:hypothetical protein